MYRLQELARQGSLSDAFIAGGDDEGLHPGTEEEEGEEVEVEEEEDEGGRCSHDGDEDGTRSENAFQEGEMDWIYQRSEKDHGEEEQEEEEQEQEQEEEEEEEEMKREYNRCLIASQPRVSFSSPSHPELNGACKSEGGWVTGGGESEQEEAEEEEEEKEEVPGRNGQIAEEQKEELVFHLLHLESQVRATQFSSTEDELERRGDDDCEREGGARGEKMAARLCRLAEQVSAGEFSSTDDEREESPGRSGAGMRGREDEGGSSGMLEKETFLWSSEAESAIQPSQLQDLASLVNDSQFSSMEDELDWAGVGDDGGGGGGGGGRRRIGRWGALNRSNRERKGRKIEERRFMRLERDGVSMESTAERKKGMVDLARGILDLLDAQEAEGIPKAVDDVAQAMEEVTGESQDQEGDHAESSDRSGHEKVESDGIMNTAREEGGSHLYDLDGEMAVLSMAVGERGGPASQERDLPETVGGQGDGSTLDLLCSSERDLGCEMRTGGDRMAVGSEEQGAGDSGSLSGDIHPEDQTSILSPEEIQNVREPGHSERDIEALV